jgi:hypothetical protein
VSKVQADLTTEKITQISSGLSVQKTIHSLSGPLLYVGLSVQTQLINCKLLKNCSGKRENALLMKKCKGLQVTL